jgi:hypothetical protein
VRSCRDSSAGAGRAIPSRAKSSISLLRSTMPKADGPSTMPTTIKATISGWRKNWATAPPIAARPSMAPTCTNTFSNIKGSRMGPNSGLEQSPTINIM